VLVSAYSDLGLLVRRMTDMVVLLRKPTRGETTKMIRDGLPQVNLHEYITN